MLIIRIIATLIVGTLLKDFSADDEIYKTLGTILTVTILCFAIWWR